MINWRNEKNRQAARRLERVAPLPSVGTGAAGMEPEKDRRSPRSNRGSREPMDEGKVRAGGRGISGKNCRGTPIAPLRRAIGAASHAARSGGTGAWVCRSSVDDGARGSTDQKAVWGEVPSRPPESSAEADQVQRDLDPLPWRSKILEDTIPEGRQGSCKKSKRPILKSLSAKPYGSRKPAESRLPR